MRSRVVRELTGAGFVLSTIFLGAGRAEADSPPESPDVGGDVSETGDASIARARVITGLPGWPGVRSLWRELDGMGPSENGYSFGVLDWEQAGLMRGKLDGLAAEMTAALEDEGLSAVELRLVVDVARMRIEMMSTGLPSMLTRMMPPPVEYDKGALLEEMEAQIDRLVELRESGLIDLGQLRSATGRILDTFMAVSVLNAVSQNFGYPYMYDFEGRYRFGDGADSVLDAVQMADMALAELERQFDSLAGPEAPEYVDTEDVRLRYRATMDTVEEVRGAVTGTGFLLGDLLLGDV
jgi:hypothetical protein